MNNKLKLLLLSILLVLNYFFISMVEIKKVDWGDFFPQTESSYKSVEWFSPNIQYLFIEFDKSEVADKLLSDAKIINYYQVDEKSNLHLLIFDSSQQNELLKSVETYDSSATSKIGLEIMKTFTQEINTYIMYVVPILLLLLFFLISFTYWLDILLELSGFYLLLATTVVVTGYTLSSASLLALLFLIIYAFTLFNYLLSGEIDKSKLTFGIVISIVTTALSSLFLYLSDFGLISSFGSTMLVGLGVLLVYLLVRIFLIQSFYMPLRIFSVIPQPSPMLIKMSLPVAIAMFILVSFSYKNISIDLNPLNMIGNSSTTMSEINEFEEKHLPSLPFVIEVVSQKDDFNSLTQIKELAKFSVAFEKESSAKILADVNVAYKMFAEQDISTATDASYAQFLLIMEMSEGSTVPVFSSDFKKSYITVLIPISSNTSAISTILHKINALDNKHPELSINVLGKIADMEKFGFIFLKEFAMGIVLSISFIFLFFVFYCKTTKIFIIVLSTSFSLLTLSTIHLLFDLNITLMTLISVVLFTGLIADSLIHIFICYKEHSAECFKSVTKPILLSNTSMLIGLAGMMVSGPLMRQFSIELSILLLANLIFIIYLMPALLSTQLFKKHIYQDDSCEIKKS